MEIVHLPSSHSANREQWSVSPVQQVGTGRIKKYTKGQVHVYLSIARGEIGAVKALGAFVRFQICPR